MLLPESHERLENSSFHFFRHPCPRILEIDFDEIVMFFRYHRKRPPLRHGVAGIAGDVVEHAHYLILVHLDLTGKAGFPDELHLVLL